MVEPIGSSRLTRPQQLRKLGNWANLTTPAGLLIARIGGARLRRGPRGLHLADRYRFRFPIAGAFTVGNVVITHQTWPQLLAASPNVLLHEERHSWQYLICGGFGFFPLYGLAMLWSWLRTGNLATDNVFERNAGLADGGYV
ncbi:MAG TPA: hypothetical protein VIP98_14320 [Microlunatus sp.]